MTNEFNTEKFLNIFGQDQTSQVYYQQEQPQLQYHFLDEPPTYPEHLSVYKRHLPLSEEYLHQDKRQKRNHPAVDHLYRIDYDIIDQSKAIKDEEERIMILKRELNESEARVDRRKNILYKLQDDSTKQKNLVKKLMCHHGINCRRQHELNYHATDMIHEKEVFNYLRICHDGVDCVNAQCQFKTHLKRQTICIYGIKCIKANCIYVHDKNAYVKTGYCLHGIKCSFKNCKFKHNF